VSGTTTLAFQSITCSSDGAGCGCDGIATPTSEDETGTYSIAAGTLTTVHGGMTDSAGYCVRGSTMHQMPITADAQVSGAVIFTKQ
jgi:hypothetical protein